ncbi:patatin-like phospholipase family protein [Massilia rhizosphaerae]|uniref:patatin-like phospholipase family protein n=1 Tax=Massilia rhizosphaerae TaxID=2784389 RepID=UPI0018DBFCBA|nr:patatin-like phospholipase family protein [Massilia rhizosphaerae]
MDTPSQQQPGAADAGYRNRMSRELDRIRLRRAVPARQATSAWGLCLSGGGIRSATFCLGVLQALSRAPRPPGAAALPFAGAAEPEKSLLGQFDYLSTVSGGGYIGTFFASLFVPGRADPTKDEAVSAANAYATLRKEPPRLRTGAVKDAGCAYRAMAWLRENGRYLAPSSAGDLLYGVATALRAWFGLHLVLGLLLLLALALLNVVKNALLYAAGRWPWTQFVVDLSKPGTWLPDVWLSGLWMFPVAVLALLAVPCGCAYWMTYPPRSARVDAKARQSTRYWLAFALCAACVAVAIAVAAGVLPWLWIAPAASWDQAGTPFAVVLAQMALGTVWFLAAGAGQSFAALRLHLTRQLTRTLKLAGVLAFLALVDTIAQSFYAHDWTLGPPLTATAILTWLTRRLAPHLAKLGGVHRTRIPVDVLLGLGAAALAILLVSVWDYGVIWLQWQGVYLPCRYDFAAADLLKAQCGWLFLLLLAAGGLTGMIGPFPQFLNLSSLQGLYSARLTRAYQGASNAERFQDGDKTLSSAEPLDSDHIKHDKYNANRYAPLHLINVCLNQNVDPAEQLVQRDRKGRPMVVLPAVAGDGPALPFAIDGKCYPAGDTGPSDPLTIGEWIGVSGAAAATGSGRRTSAAMALLLGLANVRLGRWWRSGLKGDAERSLARLFRRALPTQAYLVDELGAHFYGTRRPLHYLSDGGHFDNTGIYELLRRERDVKFIVACDCGADPGYRFDDLADLIRLARIDFDVDIEVDETVTNSLSRLRHVFGTPEELAQRRPGSNKCALLLNVFRSDAARRGNVPDMRIVLIKPILIADAPLDVHNYGAINQQFPQQTTGDQFFDEAQWESYRRLGVEIGRRIFDPDDADQYKQLWDILACADGVRFS